MSMNACDLCMWSVPSRCSKPMYEPPHAAITVRKLRPRTSNFQRQTFNVTFNDVTLYMLAFGPALT